MNDSRDHILKTAYLLFLQKNYKAVTMKEIVNKSGLSKGAFYHYFSSKEELFKEIVNHYFLKLLDVDYSRFSQESLQAFYQDVLNNLDNQSPIHMKARKAEKIGGLNFYALIFEAIRILPDFKAKFFEVHAEERKAWMKIIEIAKAKGEIKPTMADEHVARLFIYTNDGASLSLILNSNFGKLKEELLPIYNGLYDLLKT